MSDDKKYEAIELPIEIDEVSKDALFLRETIASGGDDDIEVNVEQVMTRNILIFRIKKKGKKETERVFTVDVFKICNVLGNKFEKDLKDK